MDALELKENRGYMSISKLEASLVISKCVYTYFALTPGC